MPSGNVVVVITSAAGAIVSVRFTDLVCAGLSASTTLKVSGVAFTAAVGVPVIAPVAASNARPAGSVPAVIDHVYGTVPPVAARVVL